MKPHVLIEGFDEEKLKDYLKSIDEVAEKVASTQPIVLQIESNGGLLSVLSTILAHLEQLPNPIHTYTAGDASSAGCMLLTLGNFNGGKRIIHPSAGIMWHALAAGKYDSVDELVDWAADAERYHLHWCGRMADAVFSKEDKGAADFLKLVKKNTKGRHWWMDAKAAKKNGFVDEIGCLKMKKVPATWEASW